jgi:hypothetical protein
MSGLKRVKVGSLWRYKGSKGKRWPHVRYQVVALGEWRSSYVTVNNVVLLRDDLLPTRRRSREHEQWLLNNLEECNV